jgi:hypothetical protein
MRWRISASLVLSTCVLAGCNKDDATGPAVPPPSADSSTSHPTTQQLLNGPRTALELRLAPVTLQVPPGWEVKPVTDGPLILEGPTPTNDVSDLTVTASRTITIDQEAGLESHAQQDFKDHPDLLEKPGVRNFSGGKVIEHLVVDPILATSEPTAAVSEPIQTLKWTFTVCIPSADGKEFNAWDLRFLGMTVKQYKTDQAFLRSIIDSLAYAPATDTLTK